MYFDAVKNKDREIAELIENKIAWTIIGEMDNQDLYVAGMTYKKHNGMLSIQLFNLNELINDSFWPTEKARQKVMQKIIGKFGVEVTTEQHRS